MALIHRVTVKRHCVPVLDDGLSPMQKKIIESNSLINIVSAPTGAGKSYAFRKSVLKGERVLFIVATKRLGQNQYESMIRDLIDPDIAASEGREPWSENKARLKVQNWNSDFKETSAKLGFKSSRDYYTSRMSGLDVMSDEGEIIFITPETLSHLFLRPSRDGKSGDVGPSAIVNWFDKIVYDEFHTIDERGFGLVTTIAMTAKHWSDVDGVGRRASIFLLSATPVDLSGVLEKFGFNTNDINEVKYIKEEISEHGRALHGDVVVEFHDKETPGSIVRNSAELQSVSDKEKIVIIYDSIKEMIIERPEIESIFKGQSFLFDSGLHSQMETESSGKSIQLDDKNVIVGTSSIEMGVTIPHAVKMVTDAGFSPLSLLQRIGRVSRGDVSGIVKVVFHSLGAYPWLHEIIQSLKACGEEASIEQFSDAFASAAGQAKDFSVTSDKDNSLTNIVNFGTLGNRAYHCAALYHTLLHQRMKSHGNIHFSRRFSEILRGKMGGFTQSFNKILQLPKGNKWMLYFLSEAERLRDFSPTITLITESGNKVVYSSFWIRKNTRIFDIYHVEFDSSDKPFIRIHSSDLEKIQKGSQQISTRTVMMPDGSWHTVSVHNAMHDFFRKMNVLPKTPLTKEGYAAVQSLVLRTGVLPYGEEDVPEEAITAIL